MFHIYSTSNKSQNVANHAIEQTGLKKKKKRHRKENVQLAKGEVDLVKNGQMLKDKHIDATNELL